MYAWKPHGGEVVDIDYSSDGRWIASASNDRTALLWRAGDFHSVRARAADTLSVPPEAVTVCKAMCGLTAVVFSPNSRFIASGTLDHSVYVWDIFTGSCIATCKGGGTETDITCSLALGPTLSCTAQGVG